MENELYTKKIAILGCGNIGTAIVEGILLSGKILPQFITLTRRTIESLNKFADRGCLITTNNKDAVSNSDIIIICVTPSQIDGVLGEIKNEIDRSKLIISVVSGASIESIIMNLHTPIQLGNLDSRVIRAMPNIASAKCESMTCICGPKGSKDLQIVTNFFDNLGTTMIIEESQMSAAIVLCASGVAFFCKAIRAASQAGVEIGFSPQDAIKLSAQTAKGAAKICLNSHPELEIDKITTPKGCTITGLNKLENSGFSSGLIQAITESYKKTFELYRQR